MSGSTDVARILVCEDSPTFALGLKRFLEHDPDLRVAATCGTADEAVTLAASTTFDLIVMDLELPDAPGTSAIERIMKVRPTPILVLSAHAGRGSRFAVEALGAGALDARPKSDVSLRAPATARAAMFRRLVKRLARTRMSGRWSTAPAPADPAAVAQRSASVIGIAASTGGPLALQAVLRGLPANFPIPVLIVQHMAEGFIDGLAEWLDGTVEIPVALASDGASLTRGAWIAPDGAHLILDASREMRLDTETIAGYHRPAADVLFSSVATVARSGGVSVVLTGMGTDGADGTAAVRSSGGLTMAQDPDSAALYGMPRAAVENGAEVVLPLDHIGPALAALGGNRGVRA